VVGKSSWGEGASLLLHAEASSVNAKTIPKARFIAAVLYRSFENPASTLPRETGEGRGVYLAARITLSISASCAVSSGGTW